MDSIDEQLLNLLERNSRATTAELARQLGLARSTIKDRISRLERRGVIKGYRLVLGEQQAHIAAHVMIKVNPKQAQRISQQIERLAGVKALYTINGEYDLLAILKAPTTDALDQILDAIGNSEGIERTQSSIILATKFER